jgi:hypothetical protein
LALAGIGATKTVALGNGPGRTVSPPSSPIIHRARILQGVIPPTAPFAPPGALYVPAARHRLRNVFFWASLVNMVGASAD